MEAAGFPKSGLEWLVPFQLNAPNPRGVDPGKSLARQPRRDLLQQVRTALAGRKAALALLLPVAVCALLMGCGTTGPSGLMSPPNPGPPPALELAPVAAGFTNPLDLQQPNDQSNRLFVVEQGGKIRIVDSGGNVLPGPYLDLTSRVTSGGEMGLLGLAFHPSYSQNGCFYVNYTTTRFTGRLQTVIAEYRAQPASSNSASTIENILFTVDQPANNHNGGGLAFGPDGMLYIGLGDGGGAGDPFLNGQRVNTRLGKLLRIAVSCGSGYSVPADNPFAGQPSPTNEIWALGLRNPWRFSFDALTSRLLLADVGQDRFEEVDLVTKGANLGWNTMEGNQCFSPSTGCNQAGLTLPIFTYDHSQNDDSIVGGYVYRGSQLPDLVGVYFYGDYGTGAIWSLYRDAGGQWQNSNFMQTGGAISSFGQDDDSNLYVVNYAGAILRFDPAS